MYYAQKIWVSTVLKIYMNLADWYVKIDHVVDVNTLTSIRLCFFNSRKDTQKRLEEVGTEERRTLKIVANRNLQVLYVSQQNGINRWLGLELVNRYHPSLSV